MRWSLVTSFLTLLLLTSLVEGVFSYSEDVYLGRRGVVKSKKVAKLTSSSLKKSSSTYRKAALKGKTYTKAKAAGKVKAVRTPKKPPKGKDADHKLEAQTVKHALHKGGIKDTNKLGSKAHTAVKNTLNHPKNMAYVDKDINRKKGHATKSALAGKKPSVSSHVKDYVKKTAHSSLNTAKSIDNTLKKHGVKGVNVHKEQKGVLKKLGVKREVSLDELD